jgi:hypothetical protein
VLAGFWVSRERSEGARDMTGRHYYAVRIHHETRSDDVRDTVVWAESESGGYGK